jgi:micrococcal nuclease
MARRSSRKRRRLWTFTFVLVVALAIVAFRFVEHIGPERAPGDRFVVKRVIDGDTVELQGGDRLRLLGIDTPEMGERFHDEAMNLLKRLALGKNARIEYARERRDRYGRLLGFLYIDDTLFVNRLIVDSGMAYIYLFRNNELEMTQFKQLLDAQRDAMSRHTALWSIGHRPEAYYVSPDNSFRLHRPSCPSVQHLKPGHYRTFQTREEGLSEGLSPCRNCKP